MFYKNSQLEKVLIANAFKLETARAICQPFAALITTPCQVWSHSTYPLPYCSFFAADTLLYAVTVTFDLEQNSCSVLPVMRLYQIWTQSSNPRLSYCNFNVWPYDLEHCVTCYAQHCDNFHQVWPSTTYLFLNYRVFDANTRCDRDLWPLTLNFYSTSGVMRLNSVQNLSEIE